MEYNNRDSEIIKSDKEIEDICNIIKGGFRLGYSCNPNLTQQQKQQLSEYAKQICEISEQVAKLINHLC